MIKFNTKLLEIKQLNHDKLGSHALLNNSHVIMRGTQEECIVSAQSRYPQYIEDSIYFQNLADQLEEKSEVTFTIGLTHYQIWETDQGEENIRGEECMNFMIEVFEDAEILQGDEAQSFDGGLCTGTPLNAVQFMIGE